MPAARKRTRGRSDEARTRPSPTASLPSPSRERERLETLRGDFDEAALHVAQLREFTGFRLGPVVEVPPTELAAGTIGWRRRVDWSPPASGDAGGDPEAWLSLLVGAGAGESVPPGEGPGGGGPTVRIPCLTTPPSILVASSRSDVGAPLLERLARATCAELESGD